MEVMRKWNVLMRNKKLILFLKIMNVWRGVLLAVYEKVNIIPDKIWSNNRIYKEDPKFQLVLIFKGSGDKFFLKFDLKFVMFIFSLN